MSSAVRIMEKKWENKAKEETTINIVQYQLVVEVIFILFILVGIVLIWTLKGSFDSNVALLALVFALTLSAFAWMKWGIKYYAYKSELIDRATAYEQFQRHHDSQPRKAGKSISHSDKDVRFKPTTYDELSDNYLSGSFDQHKPFDDV